MGGDIELKWESCLVDEAQLTAGKKRKAPLQTIDVKIKLNKIAADILGLVTRRRPTGYKYIFVLTDFFTKYVASVPLESSTAEVVANALVEYRVFLFGTPDSLQKDQGTNFCSKLIMELCRLLAVDITRPSVYHPRGNGMVERHNRVTTDVISKYCSGNPWDEMLPYLSFVYNKPFNLMFDQDCIHPINMFFPKK